MEFAVPQPPWAGARDGGSGDLLPCSLRRESPVAPFFVFSGIGYVELARMDVQVQQGGVLLEQTEVPDRHLYRTSPYAESAITLSPTQEEAHGTCLFQYNVGPPYETERIVRRSVRIDLRVIQEFVGEHYYLPNVFHRHSWPYQRVGVELDQLLVSGTPCIKSRFPHDAHRPSAVIYRTQGVEGLVYGYPPDRIYP